MNDFIKGDTSLIKDLTDELNRLQTKVAELTNNLNIANLELANKEQERQDVLNDNKYNKNLCSKLTQQLTETNKLMQEYLSKCLSLEQQLAEKDKEIEKLKIILSMQAVQVPEEQRLNLITTNCIQYNPNRTTIAELNKVRELMTKKVDSIKDESLKLSFRTFVFTISNAIDQRINVLKGETNESN